MRKKKKYTIPQTIGVYFCTYMPYDNWPMHQAHLGDITHEQATELINALTKSQPLENFENVCIKTIRAEYSDNATIDRRSGCRDRYSTLELSNMFYLERFPCHALCAPLGNKSRTEVTMMRKCAANLRAGLCRDEFIRRTLGATLFPQHYASKKQNTK